MTQQTIELLGWLPQSERLLGSMERAFAGATAQGAAEVGLEHLLAAFAEDVDVNVYLTDCGVARGRIAAIVSGAAQRGANGAAAHGEGYDGAPSNGVHANGAGYGDAQEEGERGAAIGLGGDSYFYSRESQAGHEPQREQPQRSYDEGYAGGYANGFGAHRAAPKPGKTLRRLMARVCEAAERLGREELSGELVVQVMAVDEHSAAAVSGLLPAKETARLKAALAPPKPQSEEPKRKKNAEPKEVAFKALFSRLESMLLALHGELQNDMRYRLVNDLTNFVNHRAEGGAELHDAALPVLQASRAELVREPQYQALERLRGALRTMRMEEREVRAVIADLMRHGRLAAGAPTTRAAEALIEMPAQEDLGPETCSAEAAPELLERDPTAPPALAEPRPEPQPEPEPAKAPTSSAQILHRVFGSRRQNRRRDGDASAQAGWF